MKKKIVYVLCGLLLVVLAASAEENAQKTLDKILLGRPVQLRIPCGDANLQYDRQGKLLNSSQPSPWTVDGVFMVDKISLAKDKLEIKGNRVLVALKLGPNAGLISLQTKKSVKVIVNDFPSDAKTEQVLAMLDHLFVGGNVREHIANYWKASIDISQSLEQMRKQSRDGIVGRFDQERPVYLPETEYRVNPPKMLSALDADYGRSALRANGEVSEIRVLVNEYGRPELVGLLRDTKGDFGLQTLYAVAHWKFSPAVKDGAPVASLISVETEIRSQ